MPCPGRRRQQGYRQQRARRKAIRKGATRKVRDHRQDAIDGEYVTQLSIRNAECLQQTGPEKPRQAERQHVNGFAREDQCQHQHKTR
jgi:hypothetical protein